MIVSDIRSKGFSPDIKAHLAEYKPSKVSSLCLEILSQIPYVTLEGITETLRAKFDQELQENTPNEIFDVIHTVITHEPKLKNRFHENGKLLLTSSAGASLARAENNENERSISWLKHPSKQSDKLVKLIKYIAAELTALKPRPTAEFEGYTQRSGHINELHKLTPDLTISSDTLKQKKTAAREYNINLSRISLGAYHVLVRSGRSETIPRIIKLIQYNFLASVRSENHPGIRKRNGKLPLFQIVLCSALDPHLGREILKKFQKKVRKSGPASLQEMQESVNLLWSSYETKLKLEATDESGKRHEFYALKPILLNFVLSEAASDKQTIEKQREFSRKGALRLLKMLSKTRHIKERPHFQKATKAILSKADFKPAKGLATGNLTEKKILNALQGVKITLTQRDLQENDFTAPHSPVIEANCYYDMIHLLNVALSVQCKAGCDRASLFTGLYLAKQQQERETGEHVDLNTLSPKEKEVFARRFSHLTSEFALPIITVSRGSNDFKVLRKPIIDFLYNHPSEEELPGIFPKLHLVAGT